MSPSTSHKRRIIDAERPSNDIEWTCSLPPRCSSEPRTFHTLDEFESHYHLEHAHHCTILTDEIDGQQAERGGRGILCGKIFPSDHLLQCHIDEVQRHPYSSLPGLGLQCAIRLRGRATRACDQSTCVPTWILLRRRPRGHRLTPSSARTGSEPARICSR